MGRRRCVSDLACASVRTSAAPSPTSCSSRRRARFASSRCSRRRPTTTAPSSRPCGRSSGTTRRRRGRPRDDGRDERRAREARRAHRDRDDPGLPGRARAAPDADAAPVRLLLAQARRARPAAAAVRGRRAHVGLGRDDARAHARGGAAGRGGAPCGRGGIDCGLLAPRAPLPRARGAARRGVARGAPGRAGLALLGDPPRAAGVRAHCDDGGERVHPAVDGRVRRDIRSGISASPATRRSRSCSRRAAS